MSEVRWIPHGNFEPLRYRPGGVGNWSGHLPFASDLIAVVRPKLLVELGTHYGESYFCFCQAVAEHKVPCSCYAVDTWVGEEQTGHYDESVYQDVQPFNEAHYKSFSYLLRTTFDQALENFSENSIDILHIDGLHTHEAVSHDFHSWFPKVKPGGVVLLHDVAARHADFGVWKVWEELAGLGERFLFTHSWGLGVFRKPLDLVFAPDELSFLFRADSSDQHHLRTFYSLCAVKLEHDYYQTHQANPSGPVNLEVQVFPKIAEAYSLETCYKASLQAGEWQKLRIELSAGVGEGPMRVDLAQRPCIIDLASISIREGVRDEVLWTLVGPAIASLQVAGDMSVLASREEKEFCRFLSTGNDPQLFLPLLPGDPFDQPLYLEIWVRAYVEPSSLLRTLKLQHLDHQEQTIDSEEISSQAVVDAGDASCDLQLIIDTNAKKLSECTAALEEARADCARLFKEGEDLKQEQALLALSYRKLQGNLYVAKTDLLNKVEEHATERAELVHARNIEALKSQEFEKTIQEITSSRSWRTTAPLRWLKQRIG